MRLRVEVGIEVKGEAFAWAGDVEASSLGTAWDAIPDDALPDIDDVDEKDITAVSFEAKRLPEVRKRPRRRT